MLEQGYEGVIFRDSAHHYVQGRTVKLFKYKKFYDEEATILNLNPGTKGKKYEKAAATATVKLHDGTICTAKIAVPFEKAVDMLKNKEYYIGKACTVSYQEKFKDTNQPRFATVQKIYPTNTRNI